MCVPERTLLDRVIMILLIAMLFAIHVLYTPLSLNLRQWFSICVVTYSLTYC
jgi:hypothetical protein